MLSTFPLSQKLIPPGSRTTVFTVAVVLGLVSGLFVNVASAADATFVGSLALALDPEVAKKLDLSADTLAALTEVIDKRESAALQLSLSIKDLSPAEQDAKLAPFRAESEREGLKLLSDSQRTKLEAIRLERLGAKALTDPAVASRIKLSPEQQTQVTALLKDQADAVAKAPAAEKAAARADFERKIAALLSDSQRSTWDAAIGKTGEESSAEASAPAKLDQPAAPSTAAAAEGKSSDGGRFGGSRFGGGRFGAGRSDAGRSDAGRSDAGRSDAGRSDAGRSDAGRSDAGRSGDGDRPGNGAAAPLAKTGPSPDGKIRFNFKFQPWRDVLEWFASQADLSLIAENPPPGTFNYQDTKAYTPAEAIDLLNGILLTKGYTLVRSNRLLMLIDLRDGVPPNLVENVPVEELDKRGRNELVAVTFRLDRLTPEKAESEVKKLLGPQGSVVVLAEARRIVVTDTAGRLRTARDMIDAIERPEGGTLENLRSLPVKFANPADALTTVKLLLNIPPERSATLDGTLRIVADPIARNLLVSGKKEQIAKVEEVLKLVDVASNASMANATALEGMPQIGVYTIAGSDPTTVLQVLQTILSGTPDVRLTIDPGTGHLIALARPSQHATIRATIDEMQRDSRRIEVIRLRNIDPQVAALSINKLFASSADPAAASTAPKVDADPINRQLIVRGTVGQISQIREMLEKMGETDIATGEAVADRTNIRMIPLTGRSARTVISQLEQVWPTLHKNRIRMVSPSAVAPTLREGAGIRALDYGIPQRRLGGTLEPTERAYPTADRMEAEPSAEGDVPRIEVAPPASSDQNSDDNPETTSHRRSAPQRLRVIAAKQVLPLPADSKASDGSTAPAESAVPSEGKPAAVAVRGSPNPSTKAPAERSSADSKTATDSRLAAPAPANGTAAQQEEPAPIIIAPGPGGIMIASDDLDALDDFESLLKTLSSRSFSGDRDFTVFYLKYGKADVVAELLEQIFGGGGGGASGGGGSLLNNIAGAAFGDGLMGNLLFGGGGGGGGGGTTAVRASGTVSIVPDTRLNALVVQANPTDLDTIEQMLKVLDQKNSPEDVSVVAKPQLIPVYNTSAEEIATVVRQVYADRIAGASGGGQRQPSPEEFIRALRGGNGGGRGNRGGGRNQADEQTKMTVGVDSRTNSLVVAAPESLFSEVKLLVEQLDQSTGASNETMKVVTLKRTNPTAVQAALSQIVGDQLRTSTARTGASTTNRPAQTADGGGRPNFFPGAFGQGGFGGGGFGGGGGFPGQGGGGPGGGGFGRGGGGGPGGFGGGGFGGGGFGGGGFGRGGGGQGGGGNRGGRGGGGGGG